MDISFGYQSSCQKCQTLSNSMYFTIANFHTNRWDLCRGKGPSAVGDAADTGRATGEVYLVSQQLLSLTSRMTLKQLVQMNAN